jgi:hypothetical protein
LSNELDTVKRIPTQLGDVLILQSEKGVKIHAVGRVARRGQQHFHAAPAPLYVRDHHEALAVARTLVAPDGHIYLMKMDSGDWSEVLS